jgi:hypothetical protein
MYIEVTSPTRRRSRWAALRGNTLAPRTRVLGATRAVAADNVADAPTPHVPICPNCGQEGREHNTSPEPGRHFIRRRVRCALDRPGSGILACQLCARWRIWASEPVRRPSPLLWSSSMKPRCAVAVSSLLVFRSPRHPPSGQPYVSLLSPHALSIVIFRCQRAGLSSTGGCYRHRPAAVA